MLVKSYIISEKTIKGEHDNDSAGYGRDGILMLVEERGWML